jgi:dTDP-4-dehydrorhamnose 3,5-epimerase
MVTCLNGKILDVCVDLRFKSKNFGEVYSTRLLDSSTSYYIPKGFGHGFQTLTDNCIVHYSHNVKYNPDDQLDISPLSNKFKNIWELEITEISSKDSQAITLEDYYNQKLQSYKNLC